MVMITVMTRESSKYLYRDDICIATAIAFTLGQLVVVVVVAGNIETHGQVPPLLLSTLAKCWN